MVRIPSMIVLIAALFAFNACKSEPPPLTTSSGLQIVELQPGTGTEATRGDIVEIGYEGRLADGTLFDSSKTRGVSTRFRLGYERAIKAWDEGVLGMKVGGRRKLIVPPALGYPANARPASVPENATLTFEIELLKVTPPNALMLADDERRKKKWEAKQAAQQNAGEEVSGPASDAPGDSR